MTEPEPPTTQTEPGDRHLSDGAIDALASGRDDLLGADERAHHAECERCRGAVHQAASLIASMDAALAVAIPEAELDALVRSAMATVPIVSPVAAPSLAPSRRSLYVAAALGSISTLALWALSIERVPSVGATISLAQQAWATVGAADRLVHAFVPGGWPGLGVALSLLALVLGSPLLRVIAGGAIDGARLSRTAATATIVIGVLFGVTPPARALDFTGEWPEAERLTVVIDGEPASAALERAAESAGLGLVVWGHIGVLESASPVHLRVRNASLRDVLTAILGAEAPVTVERTSTALTVRAHASPDAPATTGAPSVASSAPPVPAPGSTPLLPGPPLPPGPPAPPEPLRSPGAVLQPTPPAAPTPPAPPLPSNDVRRAARDRVTMGGDVVVRPGEIVQSVVTMGGDATIGGEVMRDVVTMGGDVHVQSTGVVHGEIVAMGGEVRVEEGAVHTGETVLDGPAEDEGEGGALGAWARDLFASAARHMLLFLFGLLLMGVVPARFDRVASTMVAAPGRAGGIGLLGALAAVVIAVLLVITIVGIPGAILLAIASALAVYGGLSACALVIGRVLPIAKLEGRPVLQLGAGVLALFVASLAPVIGVLITIVAAFVGLGAVVATRAGERPYPTPPLSADVHVPEPAAR